MLHKWWCQRKNCFCLSEGLWQKKKFIRTAHDVEVEWVPHEQRSLLLNEAIWDLTPDLRVFAVCLPFFYIGLFPVWILKIEGIIIPKTFKKGLHRDIQLKNISQINVLCGRTKEFSLLRIYHFHFLHLDTYHWHNVLQVYPVTWCHVSRCQYHLCSYSLLNKVFISRDNWFNCKRSMNAKKVTIDRTFC